MKGFFELYSRATEGKKLINGCKSTIPACPAGGFQPIGNVQMSSLQKDEFVKEDFLHFIWKHKKLPQGNLISSEGEKINILDVGTHNHLAGPDFFNAKIEIEGQLWAGNVEIHLKSSDWYAHHHEQDLNYNNVILHFVWEDDIEVFRNDNTKIPALQWKDFISNDLLHTYRELFDKSRKSFINCENDIDQIDGLTMQNWLARLYFERLEQKSVFVSELLKTSKNDWEQVLFSMLLKNFGLNINGEVFFGLSQALDFSIVRKLQTDVFRLESIFFGMSHLLDDTDVLDEYYLQLKKEFKHQKNRFELEEDTVQKPLFFKLRPANFPTVRLSQLASLYGTNSGLFDKVLHASKLEEFYRIFDVAASTYWNCHFTFGKTSKKSTKKLTKKFVDLLLINTILPVKFCYAMHKGMEINTEIETIMSSIKTEQNSVVDNFGTLGVPIVNGKDSQAILQLYKHYCTKNKCLQCAVGSGLLGNFASKTISELKDQ